MSILAHVRARLALLPPNEQTDLIRRNWQRVLSNEHNLILAMLQRLVEDGVDGRVVERILDVLIDLGLNVGDSWSAAYILYDIVKSMGGPMLGVVLNDHAPALEQVAWKEPVSPVPGRGPAPPADQHLSGFRSLADIQAEYDLLMERHAHLVLSAQPYQEISRVLLAESNGFVKRTLAHFVPLVWRRLRIPEHSPAVVFFRDLKSYGSDLDLFYWGPEPDAVLRELTRFYLLLGIKMDLYSIAINHLILEHPTRTQHPFFHAYLHLFFFMGAYVEFNAGQFNDRYAESIASHRPLGEMWAWARAALVQVLAQVNRTRNNWSQQRRDLKSLYFRAISLVLFGLSVRYAVPFRPDLEKFLCALGRHVELREIAFFRESLAFLNHARSLLHVWSGTRWEPAYAPPYRKAADILPRQGVECPDARLDSIGMELARLLMQHFPECSVVDPAPDLPLLQEPFQADIPDTESFFHRVWNRVASTYMEIMRLNRQEFLGDR